MLKSAEINYFNITAPAPLLCVYTHTNARTYAHTKRERERGKQVENDLKRSKKKTHIHNVVYKTMNSCT